LERRPKVAFLLTYVETDRWQRLKISHAGTGVREVWINGNPVAENDSVAVPQGKHQFLVKTRRPAGPNDWTTSVTISSTTPGATFTLGLDPRRPLTWRDVATFSQVDNIKASPAGDRAVFITRHVDRENDTWDSQLEIWQNDRTRLETQLHFSGRIFDPSWSANGRHLAFTTLTDREEKTGKDLWVWNSQTGAKRVLRAISGLGHVQWGPDGNWIYYTHTTENPSGSRTESVQRLTEVWHRWESWETKTHLSSVQVETRSVRKLIDGSKYSVRAPAISPDGKRIVFARDVPMSTPPFQRSEVWLLTLEDMSARRLTQIEVPLNGPGPFTWAPDSKAVAFCGPALERFKGETDRFSHFETDLYGLNIQVPRLTHLSADFAPTVGMGLGCETVHWEPGDGRIYVAATSGAQTVPARTTVPVRSRFTESDVTLETLEVPGTALESHDFARGRLIAAVETPVQPTKIYHIDFDSDTASLIVDATRDALDRIQLPDWKPWTFTDADGWPIEGWYLTPPDFDPDAQYPLLVYYYGGTLPTVQSFDDRLVRYASKGYVVYVLNPAGAPGYGQEFSNLHIDDWGYPAGSDILEGVRQFADVHSFVDADRIGAFGGSYGGFMTMHLLARSDLFAAAVALYGISNITNYWGAGWWGYSYTWGTCPDCQPWSRRDIFVDRSPIFDADKITAPLLLMHGTSDVNVVPSESEQMFTALRLLDRDVELVRFFGENHGMGSTPMMQKRRDDIILAWFNKHLRAESTAWKMRWQATDQ